MEKEMTRIRFWGGLRTIGGTIITIECGESRLIFDFGRSFSAQTAWVGGAFSLRKKRTVHDAIKLGILPRIDGLYRKKQLEGIDGLQPYEDFHGRTEVYISHLHLDHTGAMDAIAEPIPVYMTPETLQLEQALEQSGEHLPLDRRYSALELECPHKNGPITIRPIRVDHDVIGASGLHIETPDGSIVYTGDLRLHGFHPEVTEAFLNKAKQLGFQLLIMETTTLSDIEQDRAPLVSVRAQPETLITEQELAARWTELSVQTPGLVLFNVYNRNVERLHEIMQIAEKTKRCVVFNEATACVLHAFYPNERLHVYSEDQLPDGPFSPVGTAAFNANPGHYMVQCAYPDSLQLLDINLKDAVYIHAGGMPIDDYDPAYQKLLNFLQFIRLKYVTFNCSGHAAPAHLKWMLDRLDPDVLVPLHGFHPERLMPDRGHQFLPEYGRTYLLRDILGRS